VDKKLGVIIDGYSTGAQLVSAMRSLGYEILNIMSTEEVAVEEISATLNSNNFSDTWYYDGNLDKLVQRVAKLAPRFVVAGFEAGVPLAEALADRLKLPCNDSSKRGYRSNKARMGEGLKSAGIPCAGQIAVTCLDDISQEILDAIGYPIVVKPTESAGSDNVVIAHNYAEATAHVEAIFGKKNRIGRVNSEVLIQEFIQGQQYIVNSVSLDGEHFVTEIWKDNRIQTDEGQVLYDHEHLVDLNDPVSIQLANYIKDCLSALGVKYGPIHAEVIYTDTGPKLVEVGARCQGGILGETVREAIGYSHVSLTALLLADPERFLSFARGLHYEPRVMVVSLNSFSSGNVAKVTYPEHLQQLNSFKAVMSMPKVGDFVPRTRDLFTSLGVIYLVHDNFDVLRNDLSEIRSLEKKDAFFQLKDS